MKALIKIWRNHGTKVLGYIVATIPTLLLVPELIPVAHTKYWLAVVAVLGGKVVHRGHQNPKLQ